MTTPESTDRTTAVPFDGLVMAERTGRRAGRGPRRGPDGGGRFRGPEMSPLWWVIAAFFGSNILSGIHGNFGLGFMTSDQRALVGLALMGIYMGVVALAVSLMNTLRD